MNEPDITLPPIPKWEQPQQNRDSGVNARLWREHAIYSASQADMCHTILELFGGERMSKDLRDWLTSVRKIRREEAEEDHKKAQEQAFKAFRADQT